jgi:hypothetical protein
MRSYGSLMPERTFPTVGLWNNTEGVNIEMNT